MLFGGKLTPNRFLFPMPMILHSMREARHSVLPQLFQALGPIRVATCMSQNYNYLDARSLISSEVGRTLSGASYSNDTTMTDESCINYCSALGFLYAGTEYASQCCKFPQNPHLYQEHSLKRHPIVCDASIAPGADLAPNATDCNMACTGNSTEPCGGPNRLSLFWSGQTGPETNPGPPNWAFSGCWT
jgi:hypothetical protein